MTSIELQIELLTPCLVGSGTGYGALIDTDIVIDDFGIPYIPSKRIKGCLRDSAIQICESFERSGIKILPLEKSTSGYSIVNKLFGEPGSSIPAGVYFSNLFIKEYENMCEWLEYLYKKTEYFFNKGSVIDFFTEIRQQTSIDEKTGTAREHSLRTIRVAKKGLIFTGNIDFQEDDENIIKLIYFSAINLRYIGTKRTKGFGNIKCKLVINGGELDYIKELEDLCKE